MTTEEALKPCPLCGSEDLQSETGPGIQNGPTRIYCNQCDAGAPIGSWQGREQPASAEPVAGLLDGMRLLDWNRAQPEPRPIRVGFEYSVAEQIGKLIAAPPAAQVSVRMVDAAMVEMENISPPLRRSECKRLIEAALAAAAPKPTT